MASPDSINSQQPKTVADYQELADNLKQEKDAAKTQATLNSIYTAGNSAVNEVLEDNVVTVSPKEGIDEMSTLRNWAKIIDTAITNVAENLKESCKQALTDLQKVLERMNKYIRPKGQKETTTTNGTTATNRQDEPTQTDADVANTSSEDDRSTDEFCEDWIIKRFGKLPDRKKYAGQENDPAVSGKDVSKLPSKSRVKAAHQKKYTHETLVEDLMTMCGYTREEAERVARGE